MVKIIRKGSKLANLALDAYVARDERYVALKIGVFLTLSVGWMKFRQWRRKPAAKK